MCVFQNRKLRRTDSRCGGLCVHSTRDRGFAMCGDGGGVRNLHTGMCVCVCWQARSFFCMSFFLRRRQERGGARASPHTHRGGQSSQKVCVSQTRPVLGEGGHKRVGSDTHTTGPKGRAAQHPPPQKKNVLGRKGGWGETGRGAQRWAATEALLSGANGSPMTGNATLREALLLGGVTTTTTTRARIVSGMDRATDLHDPRTEAQDHTLSAARQDRGVVLFPASSSRTKHSDNKPITTATLHQRDESQAHTNEPRRKC